MLPDLHTTWYWLHTGQTPPAAEIERAIDTAQSARCQHVFLKSMFNEARTAANSPDKLEKPLAGLAASIKDLFDMAGQTTCIGSLALRGTPAATQDRPAVARLRRADAALIGCTNMVEFSFSGIGVNPHSGGPQPHLRLQK